MKKSYLLVAAAAMLIFGACQKENTSEKENETTANYSLDDYYQENRDNALQTFVVDANSPIEIHGEQGTTVTIAANNFTDAYGNVITGNVEVKLIEIFSKPDMVMMDMTTITVDGGILVSGGEFFLDVTLPGSDESLRPIEPMRVHVPAETEEPDMTLWVNNGNGWELAAGPDRAPDGLMEPWDAGYAASIMSGGWFNFDYAPPGPFCDVCIKVPAGTDPHTTDVFISIDGQMTMVHVPSSAFNGFDMYCTAMPSGETVSIVVIQMDPATGMNMYTIVYSVVVDCGMVIDASVLYHSSIPQMNDDIMNLP